MSAHVWWVDLGWLPQAYPAALSLPLLNRSGGEKKDEKAHGSRYIQGDNFIINGQNSTPLGKNRFNLFTIKIKLDAEKQRLKLKHLLPLLPVILCSTSPLHSKLSYPFLTKQCRRMGSRGL